MRKIGILLFCLSISLCGFAADTPSSPTTPTVNAAPAENATTSDDSMSNLSLTFIQTANTATLTALKGKSGYYQLTLSGASPYMTYYAERPNHLTGVASLEKFIDLWATGPNSFADNPPNAFLTGGTLDQGTNTNMSGQMIVLTSPHYDKTKSMITYVVRPIADKPFFYEQLTYHNAILMIN